MRTMKIMLHTWANVLLMHLLNTIPSSTDQTWAWRCLCICAQNPLWQQDNWVASERVCTSICSWKDVSLNCHMRFFVKGSQALLWVRREVKQDLHLKLCPCLCLCSHLFNSLCLLTCDLMMCKVKLDWCVHLRISLFCLYLVLPTTALTFSGIHNTHAHSMYVEKWKHITEDAKEQCY